MTLHATSEKDLVHKYVTLLGVMHNFNHRETEVAVMFVMTYRNVQRAMDAQDDETPEEDYITDVFSTVKEMSTKMATLLDMPFMSFRKYVKNLKNKGFFMDGNINPIFLPDEEEAQITITRG